MTKTLVLRCAALTYPEHELIYRNLSFTLDFFSSTGATAATIPSTPVTTILPFRKNPIYTPTISNPSSKVSLTSIDGSRPGDRSSFSVSIIVDLPAHVFYGDRIIFKFKNYRASAINAALASSITGLYSPADYSRPDSNDQDLKVNTTIWFKPDATYTTSSLAMTLTLTVEHIVGVPERNIDWAFQTTGLVLESLDVIDYRVNAGLIPAPQPQAIPVIFNTQLNWSKKFDATLVGVGGSLSLNPDEVWLRRTLFQEPQNRFIFDPNTVYKIFAYLSSNPSTPVWLADSKIDFSKPVATFTVQNNTIPYAAPIKYLIQAVDPVNNFYQFVRPQFLYSLDLFPADYANEILYPFCREAVITSSQPPMVIQNRAGACLNGSQCLDSGTCSCPVPFSYQTTPNAIPNCAATDCSKSQITCQNGSTLSFNSVEQKCECKCTNGSKFIDCRTDTTAQALRQTFPKIISHSVPYSYNLYPLTHLSPSQAFDFDASLAAYSNWVTFNFGTYNDFFAAGYQYAKSFNIQLDSSFTTRLPTTFSIPKVLWLGWNSAQGPDGPGGVNDMTFLLPTEDSDPSRQGLDFVKVANPLYNLSPSDITTSLDYRIDLIAILRLNAASTIPQSERERFNNFKLSIFIESDPQYNFPPIFDRQVERRTALDQIYPFTLQEPTNLSMNVFDQGVSVEFTIPMSRALNAAILVSLDTQDIYNFGGLLRTMSECIFFGPNQKISLYSVATTLDFLTFESAVFPPFLSQQFAPGYLRCHYLLTPIDYQGDTSWQDNFWANPSDSYHLFKIWALLDNDQAISTDLNLTRAAPPISEQIITPGRPFVLLVDWDLIQNQFPNGIAGVEVHLLYGAPEADYNLGQGRLGTQQRSVSIDIPRDQPESQPQDNVRFKFTFTGLNAVGMDTSYSTGALNTGSTLKIQKACDPQCQNGAITYYDICTCKCAGNWMGPTCSTCPMRCTNGQPNSQCTACDCPPDTFWKGSSCDSCQLQCFNQGIRLSSCTACSCPKKGYSGIQCQCRSITFSILLLTVPQQLLGQFQRDPVTTGSSPTVLAYIRQQLQSQSKLADNLVSSLAIERVSLLTEPTPNGLSIEGTIQDNCQATSSNYLELQSKWTKFLDGLKKSGLDLYAEHITTKEIDYQVPDLTCDSQFDVDCSGKIPQDDKDPKTPNMASSQLFTVGVWSLIMISSIW